MQNIHTTINKKLTVALAVWLLAGISYLSGLLPLVHVLAAALLIVFLFCHASSKATYLRVLSWCAVFVIGVFMALYRPEGFSYFNSISVDQLHEQGKPYQQFVNLGKFFGAAIIFIWVMLGSIKADFALALTRKNLLIAASSALGILLLAILLLDLGFIPKFSQYTIIFLVINLVITCFSEEAFYRLVVQRPSEQLFSSTMTSRAFGVLVASAFFTLTHLSDQPSLVAVMFIAGTFYAITYALTRSLASAIFAHFSVNALHFIFLPYPL